MKNIKQVFFSQWPKIKMIATWCIYAIFFFYIIYIVKQSQSLSAKLLFFVIGMVVLSIVFLFEWLKSIYNKMIAALTVSCDIMEAEKFREKLLHYDYFHGFNQSIILFDALLLLDKGEYQKCLEHLKENHDFFHGTPDYMLIAYHTELQCAYFLKNTILFDKAYSKIKKLKNGSSKKKKISPLYSWEEIEALYYFRQNRLTKAKELFENINTSRFNYRELAYLSFEKAQCELALGNNSLANQLFKALVKSSNQLYLKTLSQKKEVITFEKLK